MNIYIAKFNNASLGHDIMYGIEHNKEDHPYMRYEEIGCVTGNERCEALGENDQGVEKQSISREVWLEYGLV